MSSRSRERFREGLLEWAEMYLRDFQWRDPDLSIYEVFVAEFFLTQTPPSNVEEVYSIFLDRFPSLREIEHASMSDLEETIEPLGFQRLRSEALAEIAAENESLPTEPLELETLPRVGPYVANATLCFACSRPLPIVERNVVRAYERVFGDEFPSNPSERRDFALEVLPDDGEVARTYNLALIDFGALVCTKRDPRCEDCFAVDYCRYYTTGSES